jgi:hypothetical protein
MDLPMIPSTFNALMGEDLREEVLGWDMAPVYRNYKKVLQLLQHQRLSQETRSGEEEATCPRWILKSPAHLGNLQGLLAAFPDAKVRGGAGCR